MFWMKGLNFKFWEEVLTIKIICGYKLSQIWGEILTILLLIPDPFYSYKPSPHLDFWPGSWMRQLLEWLNQKCNLESRSFLKQTQVLVSLIYNSKKKNVLSRKVMEKWQSVHFRLKLYCKWNETPLYSNPNKHILFHLLKHILRKNLF